VGADVVSRWRVSIAVVRACAVRRARTASAVRVIERRWARTARLAAKATSSEGARSAAAAKAKRLQRAARKAVRRWAWRGERAGVLAVEAIILGKLYG